jgi:hypothetical protein
MLATGRAREGDFREHLLAILSLDFLFRHPSFCLIRKNGEKKEVTIWGQFSGVMKSVEAGWLVGVPYFLFVPEFYRGEEERGGR